MLPGLDGVQLLVSPGEKPSELLAVALSSCRLMAGIQTSHEGASQESEAWPTASPVSLHLLSKNACFICRCSPGIETGSVPHIFRCCTDVESLAAPHYTLMFPQHISGQILQVRHAGTERNMTKNGFRYCVSAACWSADDVLLSDLVWPRCPRPIQYSPIVAASRPLACHSPRRARDEAE